MVGSIRYTAECRISILDVNLVIWEGGGELTLVSWGYTGLCVCVSVCRVESVVSKAKEWRVPQRIEARFPGDDEATATDPMEPYILWTQYLRRHCCRPKIHTFGREEAMHTRWMRIKSIPKFPRQLIPPFLVVTVVPKWMTLGNVAEVQLRRTCALRHAKVSFKSCISLG